MLDLHPDLLVAVPDAGKPVMRPIRTLLPGTYFFPTANARRILRFNKRYFEAVSSGEKRVTVAFSEADCTLIRVISRVVQRTVGIALSEPACTMRRFIRELCAQNSCRCHTGQTVSVEDPSPQHFPRRVYGVDQILASKGFLIG